MLFYFRGGRLLVMFYVATSQIGSANYIDSFVRSPFSHRCNGSQGPRRRAAAFVASRSHPLLACGPRATRSRLSDGSLEQQSAPKQGSFGALRPSPPDLAPRLARREGNRGPTRPSSPAITISRYSDCRGRSSRGVDESLFTEDHQGKSGIHNLKMCTMY